MTNWSSRHLLRGNDLREVLRIVLTGRRAEGGIPGDLLAELAVRDSEAHAAGRIVERSLDDQLVQDFRRQTELNQLVRRERLSKLLVGIVHGLLVAALELGNRDVGITDPRDRVSAEAGENISDAPHGEGENEDRP